MSLNLKALEQRCNIDSSNLKEVEDEVRIFDNENENYQEVPTYRES